MRERIAGVLLSLGLFTASVSVLYGQTDSEINARLQLNLSNPGARSLGLGGAFTGLADDATAAYTNPAGLTNLSRPEISLDGRYFEFRNEFLDRGHVGGSQSGTGLDMTAGPVFGESKEHVTDLSYASIVYPRPRWAVALYRHELANFRASSQTFGAFFTDIESGLVNRFYPVQASVSVRIVNYGLSGAFRLAEWLSVGVGVSRFEYRQTTVLTRFNLGSIFRDTPDYSESNAIGRERIDGDDSNVAFNAGVLWKPNPYFSLGAVYRKGPRFDFTASAEDILKGTIQQFAGRFRVPDVYGIGLAAKPTRFLTATFDFNRVRYSQFTDNFIDVLFQPPEPASYRIDDGNEFRLGIQYAIPVEGNVLVLRAGGWRDPDHTVHYTGTRQSQQILFSGGKTEYHYSAGLGFAAGEHFQIDAGADIADRVKTGSLSTVFRF